MVQVSDSDFEDDATLQLAPMIDVVFLLLIFFMVATTFATLEQQIDLDLPQAESGDAVEAPPQELVIDVTDDGRRWIDGEALDEARLRDVLDRTARADPETPVTVRGDAGVDYGSIVAVLDLCRIAGLENAGLRTREG